MSINTASERTAIILAGGRGTRLLPYTTVLPKPLMPLVDKPILEVVVRQLSHFGFTRLIFAVGHLAELIQAYFGDGSRWGIKIEYSREEYPLGTAGPIGLIEGLDQPFLVMNGDILSSLDFGDLWERHLASKALATISLYKKLVKIDLGVIELGDRGEITGYTEKPTLSYDVSMGIYMFSPEIKAHIPTGERLDLPDLILNLLARKEQVNSYPFSGHWLDIGRPEDYAQAVEVYQNHLAEFHVE
ncbi:MAG TPA: sugar phosphate nucleotidyltransferase [Stenomitos sp.]